MDHAERPPPTGLEEVARTMPHALDRLAERMVLSCAVGVGRDHRTPRLRTDYVLHNWEHGRDSGAGTGQEQWESEGVSTKSPADALTSMMSPASARLTSSIAMPFPAT